MKIFSIFENSWQHEQFYQKFSSTALSSTKLAWAFHWNNSLMIVKFTKDKDIDPAKPTHSLFTGPRNLEF